MVVQEISSSGVKAIITVIAGLALATLMIVLRFVGRIKNKSVGSDDWIALISYILLIGVIICHLLLFSHLGFSEASMDQFSPEQLRRFLVLLYGSNIPYTCCSFAIKLSFLSLYRRIFVTRTFEIITTCLIGLLITWWLCIIVSQVILCRPVETFWVRGGSKYCIDRLKMNQATSISNAVWDFVLLLLPLPMVWNLNMTRRKKLQVTGAFLGGILLCACSVVRAIVLHQWSEHNLSEIVWRGGLWSVLECVVGVSCACMPTLASLLKEWCRKATHMHHNRPRLHGDIGKALESGSVHRIAVRVHRHKGDPYNID
ncbi:hypothetical protein F4821DRAFT_279299 [Hypoxylon rubiginosum]|uniref:Uncharacterized protein n=1 Tax=Hypoxylon rubiginosum TaxID=110542 RepID=A0ACC0CZ03_9PEZI|nr:hypothetical protein F4821DRAFT_279299 [Hypoxylon rubiginosum]